MKKFLLNWAGWLLALLTAGSIAAIFLSHSVGDRIGSGITAVIAAAAAWRCWGIAGGHVEPREPRTPSPDRRPWER